MKVLTTIDLLALPSLETPPAGHVGFGAKSDGLYQKVGTVETKLAIDGHTHTIAQITGLQGALDSKATPADIDTAVNNLEIGGRNLVLGSDKITEIVSEGGVNQVAWSAYTMSEYFNYILPEQKVISYAISFKWRVTTPEGVSPTGKIIVQNNAGGQWLTPSPGADIDKTEGAYTATNVRELRPFDKINIRIDSIPIDSVVEIWDIKFEKGNKATDWTPAPEDQVSDWSETNVNSFAFIKNKPTLLSQFTDNIGVASHIANKANPHNVTKAQVGLGNVDNVKQATKSEFDTHTGNTTIHITSTERTNWNLAYANNHTHGNKSVIDALTQGHIDVLSKLSIDANGDLKIDTNAYATGELSAYGVGSGTGGGGASYSRLDAWIDYDSTKSGWVLSALLGVDLNNRLSNVESGSATSITTTGSGNAITSVSKSGNLLTFNKGLEFSLSTHNHDAIYKPIGYVPSWSEITGKPSTFAPSAHTHTIANVTGLQGALDSKATQSDIDTAVNNLEIGGRNLLTTLTANYENGYWNADGQQVSSSSYIRTKKFYPIEPNKQYIIQSRIPCQLTLRGKRSDNTYFTLANRQNVITTPLIFTTPSDIVSFAFYTCKPDLSAITPNFILEALPKLELGNKATDWTPTPEDQVTDWNETNVNSFAFLKNKPTQLSQFTDNIGVGTHIANKANPHAVTTTQIGAVDLTTNQTIGGAKTFTGNVTAPTFIGALSGNATSATKLQTARTIAGVSFDGTANIAIPFANLASKPTTLGGYGITDAVSTIRAYIGNLSTLANSFIMLSGSGSMTDAAISHNATSIINFQCYDSNYRSQLEIVCTSIAPDIYVRNKWSGTWNTTWYKLWSSANFTNLNQLTTRNFSDLQNKPTTLSGYGITDAVTTNTAQTISGAKTFSALLTASTGVNTPKVDFGNGFTVEPSGTELVFKYNGVIKQRMLSDGSIVATGELTAYGATS